jgi:hypothetical protein
VRRGSALRHSHIKGVSTLKRPVWAVAFVILACIAHGAPSGKNAHLSSSSAPVQDVRGTDSSPLHVTGSLVTSLPPPPTPEEIEAKRKKDEDDHRLSLATEEQAWLTGGLAFIALFQLGAFIWQLRVTDKTARDAGIAADAAKASADLLPRIERAYVFVEVMISPITTVVANREYRITLTVRLNNHGKTPAILTKVRAYLMWSDAPPTQLLPTDKADRRVPDGLVIAAGSSHNIDITEVMDQVRYADIQDVVTALYVVGAIEYKDVMDVHHRTGFAWQTYPQNDEVFTSISPSPINSLD